MKLAFIDIGELGWSMYVHAHIRWHKKQGDVSVAVITYPDRRCLYEGLADTVIDAPPAFYATFDIRRQNCLGIQKVMPDVLKKFFISYIPNGYSIPENFKMGCRYHFYDCLDFAPYKYAKKLTIKQEILIFPRCRIGGWYSFRNLKESFYADLIERLCDEYPALNIRTIGTAMGAYDINVDKPNYINYVGRGNGLQDMIDRCQMAVAAVGSQSAPPKISLLQGVPTFIVGHEKERHINKENWMKTKVGFYKTQGDSYDNFDSADCIDKIVDFIKECK